MAFLQTIRRLLQHKLLLGLVLVLAIVAAILSAYQVSFGGLKSRSLSVSAASSQILVDSVPSALSQGVETSTFEALATRAKIYGQYLASLSARVEIAERAGVPPASLSTSGPFSTATGQINYSSESSGERANELLQEGASNRLVFSAQEGVPIISVDSQASDPETAVALASASYATLHHYIRGLAVEGKPLRHGVTVRQLGVPEGGTLGGSNDKLLMVLAFLLTFGLGCGAILVIPGIVARWRSLGEADVDVDADVAREAEGIALRPLDKPRKADQLVLPPLSERERGEKRSRPRKKNGRPENGRRGKGRREPELREPERDDAVDTTAPVAEQPATTG